MIQKLNDEVMTLKRQVHLMWERVRSLENCIKIADANEPCTAPVPISEATLREHKEALARAIDHAANLEWKIETLKAERNDQAEEIIELKKRWADYSKQIVDLQNQLSGWHELFGTKHLSSAKVSKEAAESIRSNMADANEWQGNKIATLNDQIANQCIIIKEYREKYEAILKHRDTLSEDRAKSCRLVALMHAAAMGKVCGPKRGVVEDIEDLRKERDSFKFESDNQAAAWKEIKTFIPDVNGLSLVEMVRHHIQELQAELSNLKANNRYQKGYGDGANAVLKQVREMAEKIKP